LAASFVYCDIPVSLNRASLRWHYPNQVKFMSIMNFGRSKVTPSSQPVYELPLFNCLKKQNGSNRSGCFRKQYVNCDVAIRHPYVGIIQIRLPVEGLTFLSARNTSSRLYLFSIHHYFTKIKRSTDLFTKITKLLLCKLLVSRGITVLFGD